jgi:hypothetical protein
VSELERLKEENERLQTQLEQKKKQEFLERKARRKDYIYKLQAGDPETVNQFMRQRMQETQNDQVIQMRQRIEYQQRKQEEYTAEKEAKFQKKLSKLTPEQKQARANALEELEMKQKEEVDALENDHTENLDVINSFFAADKDNFLKYYKELTNHTVSGSPVGKLIEGEKMNYQCVLDNEERVYVWDIDRQPPYYFTYANIVNTVEWHATIIDQKYTRIIW